MHKKRVTSVKNLPDLNHPNSTESSLSRYRKMSCKGGNVPFEDIAAHLKKCKEVCNSVSKRLNSNEKERLSITSETRAKPTYATKTSKLKCKRITGQSKKLKYSNVKMLYQNAIYKSLNLNYSQSNSSVRSGTNSRDVSLKSRDQSDWRDTLELNNEQHLMNIKIQSALNSNFGQRSFQNLKVNFKSPNEWLTNTIQGQNQRCDSPELKSQMSTNREKNKAAMNQLYSPSDASKIVKRKSKADLSIDKMLFSEKSSLYINLKYNK